MALQTPIGNGTAGANNTVTLLDGTVIPLIYVTIVPATQRFYYNSVDVTNLIPRSVKLTFPGFDLVKDNLRLSNERRNAGGTGASTSSNLTELNTNTGQIFVQNVEDQLTGYFDSAKSVVKGVVITDVIMTAGIIAVGAYLVSIWLKGNRR